MSETLTDTRPVVEETGQDDILHATCEGCEIEARRRNQHIWSICGLVDLTNSECMESDPSVGEVYCAICEEIAKCPTCGWYLS